MGCFQNLFRVLRKRFGRRRREPINFEMDTTEDVPQNDSNEESEEDDIVKSGLLDIGFRFAISNANLSSNMSVNLRYNCRRVRSLNEGLKLRTPPSRNGDQSPRSIMKPNELVDYEENNLFGSLNARRNRKRTDSESKPEKALSSSPRWSDSESKPEKSPSSSPRWSDRESKPEKCSSSSPRWSDSESKPEKCSSSSPRWSDSESKPEKCSSSSSRWPNSKSKPEKSSSSSPRCTNSESNLKKSPSSPPRRIFKQCHGDVPELIRDNPDLDRYYIMRTILFTKYDRGIQLDKESWYSVTPEKIARHIADRCRCDVIIDGFCGVGGNAIQFAFTCERVIAIDIDPEKIAMAKHNAAIYGVADRITFIVGDFFQEAPKISADVVFLSPPWGGPQYDRNGKMFPLSDILPRHGKELFQVAQRISPAVAYYLPRTINVYEVIELCGPGNFVEVEQNIMKNKVRAVTCYFGELARTDFISNADSISEAFEYDEVVPAGNTDIKLKSL